MEAGLLQSLDDLGYDGPMLHRQTFRDAMRTGLESQNFVELLHWLATSLIKALDLHCTINPPDECNYDVLMQEEEDIFATLKQRMFLLEYLCTELHAAIIIQHQSPLQQQQSTETTNPESPGREVTGIAQRELQRICRVLGISPAGDTVNDIFNAILGKVKLLLNELPANTLGKPLLTKGLTKQQLTELNEISEELIKQYTMRKQMLLTRLDVTIQSFYWADRIKEKEAEITEVYASQRQNLTPESNIGIANLFSARTDLLRVSKTCSGIARAITETEVNKVVIGKVPDRGGRVDYDAAADMPQFRERTEPSNRRGGGGASGGGRGRVQGRGWQHGHTGQQNRNQNKSWGQRGSHSSQGARGRNVFHS
ncbi:uncharacterized protein TRIADDRAFT_61300 [Trichoplax adhaerens]|uniref:Protein FAM98A n=1 Tax=Trichoplax adhaerens TaxID=10228 RepID=B3SAL3_TRIAD|nr:hypothetical protein TRIADDRAFT_61300 [Trichoplax adhaerens]EDV20333.1 hypothetical protein TRIADDRAFT_61300 [Trichoplax adhaerens]|eukprot:XP_002117283.1 hypothetical protein TRIADDRAFT_61300 [Trichoplax adhaerens]